MDKETTMNTFVSFHNIKWDCDDPKDLKTLPTDIILKVKGLPIAKEDQEEFLINLLSDKYGFTHNGFNYEVIGDDNFDLTIGELAKKYAELKQAEKVANLMAKKLQADILTLLDGDTAYETDSDVGRFKVTAQYGKSNTSLNRELIEEKFDIKITEDCYKESAKWNEIRVKELGSK